MATEYVPCTLPRGGRKIKFAEELFPKASHILIGGATGCGKSTLIEDYIYSTITTKYPSEVSFCLVDPKRVALVQFKNLPHTIRYVTEKADTLKLLDDIIFTMDNRYKDMAERGLKKYDKTRIVVIIDELGDLMTTCKKEIMPRIQRIAQLGRASGIMLICATQCPNRRIIPAEMTVNFDGRVGMKCLNCIESKQILNNRKGAELLPQHGKAIYLHSNGKYYEIDIPLIEEAELDRVVRFLSAQKISKEQTEVKQNEQTVNKDRQKWYKVFSRRRAVR